MVRKSTQISFEQQSSLRFLILGRNESQNRISLVVTQAKDGMTVTVVDETVDVEIGIVGERLDVMTEDVTVMIEAVAETAVMTGAEIRAEIAEMAEMTYPSKFQKIE